MRKRPFLRPLTVLLLSGLLGTMGPSARVEARASRHRLPYAAAGLTPRQAAAHLLDRFGFGARPGDVDRVLHTGIEKWLDRQLSGKLPDPELDRRLAPYDAVGMSADQIATTYPNFGMIRAQAVRDGAISPTDIGQAKPAEYRQKLLDYAKTKGYRLPNDLTVQLLSQKVIRAVYSRNQLAEVLTDFWFNHFNVSMTNNQTRPYLLSYERDAIRPHVLGKFRDLLGATAKHPAMLIYLDNFRSTAPPGAPTTLAVLRAAAAPGDPAFAPVRSAGYRARRTRRAAPPATAGSPSSGQAAQDAVMAPALPLPSRESGAPLAAPSPGASIVPSAANRPAAPGLQKPRRPAAGERGINENYARELMELHTLGVDGGYTQQDVIQVARAFTGWTYLPAGTQNQALLDRIALGPRAGFIRQGDFLFRPGIHDAGEKMILGQAFPANGGMDEGERVLDMLAKSPKTAHHLCYELASRFVMDDPPAALVDRLANTYLKSDGDLRAVMLAIAQSPEFWSKDSVRAKIKSPFELVASALRAVNADVEDARPVVQWIARIGEPLYAYQAPTGYPDGAQQWVSTGALLTRMNFGLQLANGRIRGLKFDLVADNNGREPESADAALKTYSALLLPERDLTQALDEMAPAMNDPSFTERVRAAAPKPEPRNEAAPSEPSMEMPSPSTAPPGRARSVIQTAAAPAAAPAAGYSFRTPPVSLMSPPPATLARVVGIILGSPEFQRH